MKKHIFYFIFSFFILFNTLWTISCRQGGDALFSELYQKKDFFKNQELSGKHFQNQSITDEKIKDQTITSEKIKNHSIEAKHLASMGAQNGALLFWNGNSWTPTSQGPWVQNGKISLGTKNFSLTDFYLEGNAFFEGTSDGASAWYFPFSGSLKILADNDPNDSTPSKELFFLSGSLLFNSVPQVGIGTSTLTYDFDVRGDVFLNDLNAKIYFKKTGTIPQFYIRNTPGSTVDSPPSRGLSVDDDLVIHEDGEVHMGSQMVNPPVSSGAALHVSGNTLVNGTLHIGGAPFGNQAILCGKIDTTTYQAQSYHQYCWTNSAGNSCKDIKTGTAILPSGTCMSFLVRMEGCGLDRSWKALNPGESGCSNGGMSWIITNEMGTCNGYSISAFYICY